MTKKTNTGGAPLGNTNAAKEVTSSRKNIRLYPADEATIAALIAAGYEGDRSKVMRRAIKEAMERMGMTKYYCEEHQYNPPPGSGLAFCPECEFPKVGFHLCPYCGSEEVTDLIDPHAPEGAPDMIRCEDCNSTWEAMTNNGGGPAGLEVVE